MKKKSLLIGIIQIVLSIGIFCGSGILGHLEYEKSCRTKDVLAASTKQAALFEKGTVFLKKALNPIKKGVDAIVNLRDVKVMNKKVLAPLGNAFSGLQKSCHDADNSLEESRLSFNKVANMQIEYEYKYDIFGMICMVCIFALAGIALLGNGIYLCTGEKSVKIIVLVFAMALGLFLILAGFYAYRHVEGYLSEKIHEIKMQQEEKKERLEEEKKQAAAEEKERVKKELSETDENGEQKPEKTGKQLIEQLAEQQRTAEAEAAAALKVAQEKAEAARRAAEAKAKAEAKAAEARIIAEAKAKAAETEALLIADAKRKAAEEKNRLIAEAKAKAAEAAREAEEKRKAAGAERKAFENSPSKLMLPGNVAIEMVKIKAGTFMMGSPEGELGRSDAEKQHRVTLTQDYWLGKFEVTQAQYEAVMGNNPSEYKGSNRPVENVSWEDAKKFCAKLNDLYSGKLPAGYRFDLPTEAQWEYACRAGTTTALNNGKNLTKDRACYNLNEVGWYEESLDCGTHPVGQKRPNAWGLYDMHGNVSEWCRDWGEYTLNDATDPTGPSTGSRRVLRGGSWLIFAMACRSAARGSGDPGSRDHTLGFRLALVPVD